MNFCGRKINMFYSAPFSATAFGGADYGAYSGYPVVAADKNDKKSQKKGGDGWQANPTQDPECGFGTCTSDSDCGDEMQCGFTKNSRPPSGSMCDGKPCAGYKCCQREYADYEGWDVPYISDVATLCPFDAALNCPIGCQVCDSGTPGLYTARCCDETSTCAYTSQCQIPCTASSQFQGDGVGCMYCPEKGGLVACTAQTEPCVIQNTCTANSEKKFVRPPKKDQIMSAPLAMQQLQLRARDQALGAFHAARFSQQRSKENFW